MSQRTSIWLSVSKTRPSLKSYRSGPFPALVTVVGIIQVSPGFAEKSVVSASATKSNTWITFVDKMTESATRGYPSKWALMVTAGPSPAFALYGAQTETPTVYVVSIGHNLGLYGSEGSLGPGALEKSRVTVQWSCLQVFKSTSSGLASGAPGVVNTRYPAS